MPPLELRRPSPPIFAEEILAEIDNLHGAVTAWLAERYQTTQERRRSA